MILGRNRPNTIRYSIQSVIDQTYDPIELIVVDDASDPPLSVAVERSSLNAIAFYRSDENLGEGRAREYALGLASGRFLIYLDDDDLLLPDAVETMLRAYLATSDACFVAGARWLFDDDGHRTRFRHPRFRMRKGVRDAILAGFTLVPGQVLFDADLLRDIGGWSDIRPSGTDRDMFLRLTVRGKPLLIPHPVLDYRVHPGQRSRSSGAGPDRPFLQEFAAALPAKERERARRHLSVWREAIVAESDFRDGHYGSALRHSFAASRAAPDLALSRLMAPALAWRLFKSLVAALLGSRITAKIIESKDRLRIARHREPGLGDEAS